MLAVLMDGMITRNIEARFTAAEALSFLESFRIQLDAEVQVAHRPAECSNSLWSAWDQWARHLEDFSSMVRVS